MSVCSPDEVASALPSALAGHAVLAPVAADERDRVLPVLSPHLPVEERTAVVVATSGSTGRPKGVLLSREALLAAAEQAQARLGRMTWTCVLSPAHVAGLMVLVRAHVAGTAVRFASPALDDLACAPGRNAISIVPTQLVRALERPEVLQRLARFDAILLGGAAVDAAVLERARAAGLALVTTYGMSETCGGCVWGGEPLPGVEVGLAPLGDADDGTGRIRLTGDMAFTGYRLRPDLTAATLDGRTVTTNDRGAWRDGRLAVLGRLDDVVVTGGTNVDLAAVQRAVDAVAASAGEQAGQGVVVALPDAEWGQLVTLATTGAHDLAWWRERLGAPRAGQAAPLGRHALPRRVVRLAALPLTGSGKIDRQAVVRRLLDEDEG